MYHYYNHISSRISSDHLRNHLGKTANSLGIGNTNFIWDRKRQQLTLIMETSQMIGRDINVTLKGNSLLLEAPIISSFNKPFRTHLIEQGIRDELEDGLTVIGFSELKLKYGYHYQLISCQALDSTVIKIVLGYKIWGNQKEEL